MRASDPLPYSDYVSRVCSFLSFQLTTNVMICLSNSVTQTLQEYSKFTYSYFDFLNLFLSSILGLLSSKTHPDKYLFKENVDTYNTIWL